MNLALPAPTRSLLARLLPRPLTEGERREQEAENKARQLDKANYKELVAEAYRYADAIAKTLEDMNVCYRYKKSEQNPYLEDVQRLEFQGYGISSEAIYLQVDLTYGRRPRGIGIEQLANDEILEELSLACEHPVRAVISKTGGFKYMVEREFGVGGIPNHVKFDDITERRPASADGLAIPIGVGEGKKVHYRSLGQMYSMIVAGTIGGGKSNAINVLICTLLRHNAPNRLKFVLVDLKGGVEFSFYNQVPHLLSMPTGNYECGSCGAFLETTKNFQDEEVCAKCGAPTEDKKSIEKPLIIEHRDQVPEAFRWLINEGERRMELLKGSKTKTIGQYNYKNRNKALPHIMCIIDEWADVKLDKKLGSDCEEMLINIASRFRAVGIHVVLCTQTPNKDVISIRVKNVIPARMVFACPDQYASMLLLGNSDAVGLEPAGRGIFDWAGTRLPVQTPYINNDTVESIVSQAISGEFNKVESSTHDVTDQEIFEWALNDNAGDLDYRRVYNQYRVRGLTEGQAKAFCAGYEGEIVVVGSATYKIMPGTGSRPRRLLPMKDEDIPAEKQAEVVSEVVS